MLQDILRNGHILYTILFQRTFYFLNISKWPFTVKLLLFWHDMKTFNDHTCKTKSFTKFGGFCKDRRTLLTEIKPFVKQLWKEF